MATAPLQSNFQHLLPTILLLLAPAATNPSLILATEEPQPQPKIARPGCRDKCGNIIIPFPFGIGPNRCFRDKGFEVLCDDSTNPPRAFLADKRTNQNVSQGFASTEEQGGTITRRHDNTTASPLELVGISLAAGEARAYGAVSYDCINRTSAADLYFKYQNTSFDDTPFALSATRNAVIGVGWGVEPQVDFLPKSIPYGPLLRAQSQVSCTAKPRNYQLGAVNGSCDGLGCCEGSNIPTLSGAIKYVDVSLKSNFDNYWGSNPCSYGMVVEKSWYNFSAPDLDGDKDLLKTYPWGMPFVLEFAIGNASCPPEGQKRPADHACVSAHSHCENATSGDGYICKCWDNYDGNPYVTDGCQDINECDLNPCPGIGRVCENRPGGYDCKCDRGMRGDGKTGTCKEIFPKVARVIVGAVGSVGFTIVTFLIILLKERRKMKEFYKKNGGPILEKAKLIKLFKKKELKQILKDSNIIGKGFFGEVYKGLLDNTNVAIKKPINAGVLENEQFANEVIIQSQVSHKNIVRLLGCCLEVDTPMLVYEFISKGSLHDILHDNNSNNIVDLSLDLRLSIAAQSADGLAYMHSKTNTQILHGDVKPANILLDDNFVPKIADFGLSRLIVRDTKHTEFVIGDMNYMDPVYHEKGLLTEKSDVYSFGVVILELISRRKAIHRDTHNLVNSFREVHQKKKKATELFDREIAVTEDLEVLNCLTEMAMECISLEVDKRPTMTEVAERLFMISRSRKK